MYYNTTYFQKYGEDLLPYSSYIKADNFKEAQEKIDYRNIGEVIDGTSEKYYRINNLIYLFDNHNYKDCTHCLTFICYVLLKAKLISIEEVFSDCGIFHELLHLSLDIYEVYELSRLPLIRNQLLYIQKLYDAISH